ncbi:Glyoxylate/hydroxypyruvate reductase B [Roseimaritima multifibrata]|uniref:Glyoxylate/hydroxypyruvate reductase B n=1 Tax=Roseimaritima multifibrata TaxID=1930274 RepID=A0A517MNK6_9BACT|nr:D-glycerate dehydrogenase [Roseimaritima multifibrata]QDS96460.1 Glyoxylate/hydroxypyruvate reductase B [Roseimaritima multifibrata]
MSRPKVLVTRKIPKVGIEMLQRVADVDVWPGEMPPPRDELLKRVAGCNGLLSMLSDGVDGELLDRAGSGFKVVSNYAVGYNNIDVSAAQERGVAVGNTPDVLTDSTADLAVTLLLAAARRLPAAIENVKQGEWKTWEPMGFLGVDLRGKTVGILGMGRIGLAVAQRLQGGWGMKVLYTARTAKPDADQMGAKHVQLTEMLQQSDFVSVHCPLTDQTRNLLDETKFALMQPHAVLVNTARGDVIDQEALADALEGGKIFAAGLDVTTPEPLPPTHRLVQLENCTIAPHIGSASVQSRDDMARLAAENILAGLAGKPLPNPVS